MIRTCVIKDSIISLLAKNKNVTGVDFVTGEDIEQVAAVATQVEGKNIYPILHVQVEPTGTTTLSAVISHRSILVDISYMEEDYTKDEPILDMLDLLDSLFRPYLSFADRNRTIQNATSSITDGIGHYVFMLEFDDQTGEEEKADLVGELELTVKYKED